MDLQMFSDAKQRSIVIELNGAAKRYSSRPRPGRRLWQALLGRQPSRDDSSQFVALQPCHLQIKQGEVVGIVGKNGAGKSTLLQLLSSTIQPSEGTIRVNGSISAILELGAGFNSEFSGRENIYLAMATAGSTKSQTEARLEQVIDFSGIRQFIDQPLKTYSSGMYIRLAFAIATCSEPDILIIDEALSVGDGEFARKSFDRIMQLKERGVTILFCSHSLFHIEALCSRAIWIDSGKIIRDGHPHQVIPAYQDFLDGVAIEPATQSSTTTEPAVSSAHSPVESKSIPTARLRQLKFSIHKPSGVVDFFPIGATAHMQSNRDTLKVSAWFDSNLQFLPPTIAVTLHSADGRIIASAGSWIDKVVLLRDRSGSGGIEVCFESLALLKGNYSLSIFLFCERGLHIYDNADHALNIVVNQEDLEQGLFHAPRSWAILPEMLD